MSAHESNVAEAPAADRYARQAALDEIGAEGQRRIGGASVLIVGCGALGSHLAEWAARAGVGRLILVDRDVLELHNLQRQVLFTEEDVRARLPKAVAAARRLREINSAIRIDEAVEDVTPENVAGFVRQADVVLDGTDNFLTRYLLNDAAVREGRPWIYGGVLGTEGTVMAVRPGEGPCLRCVFDEPPDAGAFATCEMRGVLGTMVGWVAALQVTEALKLLVGAAAEETRLHAMDIWKGRAVSARVRRNAACVCCGQRRFEYLDAERGSVAVSFCGRNAVQIAPLQAATVDLPQLAERLKAVGRVTFNGFLLECETGARRLVVFPDGRVMVMGTTDTAEACALAAKVIGC